MKTTDLPAMGTWLLAGHTGASSITMAGIALGGSIPNASTGTLASAPHDPSDFARCLLLVTAAPSIREDFERIGQAVPAFVGILREWDALSALYERDASTGKSQELYTRIQQLRKEHPQC